MNPKKLLQKIRRGEAANIRFADLAHLVETLGFELDRSRGSHRLYRHPRTFAKLNLQPLRSGDAKACQVRQLLKLIGEYSLKLED